MLQPPRSPPRSESLFCPRFVDHEVFERFEAVYRSNPGETGQTAGIALK